MPPKKELTRLVKTTPEGEVIQEFVEEPERPPVEKPVVENANVPAAVPAVKEQEFFAQDTFSTSNAEQNKLYELTLEFQNELTGERRLVDVPDAMTEGEAFAQANNYRQAGEILLQVIRQKLVG